jgi:hypothetical protein
MMKPIFNQKHKIASGKKQGLFLLWECALFLILGTMNVPLLPAQEGFLSKEKLNHVDQTIQTRIQSIIPVKLKLRGKPPVARWEQVDATIAAISDMIGIQGLLAEIGGYDADKQQYRLQEEEWDQLDQIFEKYTLRYSQMFEMDKLESYFPLTNRVLQIADDLALNDIPVFDRKAFSLGRYAGKYYYERSGGLSGSQNKYRLTFFQYKDNTDSIRSCGDINLLDTFTVFWPAIKEKTGYRLHSSQFLSSRRP